MPVRNPCASSHGFCFSLLHKLATAVSEHNEKTVRCEISVEFYSKYIRVCLGNE